MNLKFSIAANCVFPGTCELFPMCQDIFWLQPWFPVRPENRGSLFFLFSASLKRAVICEKRFKLPGSCERIMVLGSSFKKIRKQRCLTAFLFTPTCWSVLWVCQLYSAAAPAPLQPNLSGDEVCCWWTHTFIGTDKRIYINCSSGPPVGLAVV